MKSSCRRILTSFWVSTTAALTLTTLPRHERTWSRVLSTRRNLFGGDFCGLQAKFDANGAPQEVPSYLIPASLREWGQEPSCLEIILSEDVMDRRNRQWARQTLTIMPETGCAIDNLQTTKKIEEYQMNDITELQVETLSIRSLVHAIGNEQAFMETTFGQDDEHRTRISCTVNPQERSIIGSITVTLEHLFDSESSQGTRANGGGLDGQSVSCWLGERLRKKHNFALDQVHKSREGWIHLPEQLSLRTTDVDGHFAVEMAFQSVSVQRIFQENVIAVKITTIHS